MLFKLSIILTSGVVIPVYNEVTGEDIDYYISTWKKNINTNEELIFENSTFLAKHIAGFKYEKIS